VQIVGSYFDQGLHATDVAYSKYSNTAAHEPPPPTTCEEPSSSCQHPAPSRTQAGPGAAAGATAASAGLQARRGASPKLPPRVQLRKWGLGEVVSSVAASGLCMELLDEEAGWRLDDLGLPKTYTLLARRPGG